MPAVTQERSSRPNSSTRIDVSQRPVNMSTGSLRRHVDNDNENENDNAVSDKADKQATQPPDPDLPQPADAGPADDTEAMIVHLTRSLHHEDSDSVGVECIDLMIELLERDAMTSSMTSRTDLLTQFTHCVFTACTDFEQQLRIWLERATRLRQLMSQMYDIIDKQLIDGGGASENHVTANGHPTERADVATRRLEMESQTATARAALAAAGVHVAQAEERSASLEQVAADISDEVLRAAQLTTDTERRLNEQREEQMRLEQETEERTKLEKEAEEQQEKTRLEQEETTKQQQQQQKDVAGKKPGKKETETTTAQSKKRNVPTRDDQKKQEQQDISSWPYFIYSVEPGESGLSVGCVLRFAAEQPLNRDDVQVSRVEQLDSSLTLSVNEELLSNVVNIGLNEDNSVTQELSVAVAIPFLSLRSNPSRETVVRLSYWRSDDDSSWCEVPASEVVFDDIKESKFMEVRLSSLSDVQLAVISRIKREQLIVSRRAARAQSTVDQRVSVTFDQHSFHTKKPIGFTVQVQPVDLLTVQDVRNRFSSTCSHLLTSSPVITFQPTSSTTAELTNNRSAAALFKDSPVCVTLPLPPNPAKQRRPATSNVDRPPPGLAPPGQGDGKKGSGKDGGKESKGRPRTASATPTVVFKPPAASSAELADVVYLLTSDEDAQDGKWTVMANATPIKTGSDLVSFDLGKLVKGRMLALRMTPVEDSPHTRAETTASLLELCLQRTVVSAVLRHTDDDSPVSPGISCSADVTFQLLPPGRIERTLKKLSEEGYSAGPATGHEILVRDGQQFTVRFRGNICSEDGSKELRMVYNSNMASKLEFKASVEDRFAQKSIDVYRGFVQLYTDSSDQAYQQTLQAKRLADDSRVWTSNNNNSGQGSVKATRQTSTTSSKRSDALLCELLVSLPKPEPEAFRPIILRAPVVIRSEGAVDSNMLRHLAAELGDEWRRLAKSLGIRPRQLTVIKSTADKPSASKTRAWSAVTEARRQAVYDMLISWMKKMPRAANKANVLRSSLLACGRSDLADYVAAKHEESSQLQLMNAAKGSGLRQAIVTVARNFQLVPSWRGLCSKLSLSADDIDNIESRHPHSTIDRCYDSLVFWAQAATEDGTERNVSALIQLLQRANCPQIADILQKEYCSRH